LTKSSPVIKYALYTVIFILGLILCGQLIAQLYTIKQLNKVTGKIVKTDVKIASYSSGGRWRKGKPYYSLVITLNNGQSFDLDINNNNWQIENILQKGENVTIFYPTVAYDVLSLNVLEFGSKGSQVELNRHVVYSFAEQTNGAWPFTGIIFAGILVACYRLYGWYHGE
jgi:hypothetical protein